MINHFKSGLLLLAGLFVVACGGGGGGGASRVSGTFTVEDTSVTFEADIEDPQPDPKSVIGTVTGAEGTLYVYAHLTSTRVIEKAVIKITGDTGQLVLTPVLPSSLGNGFHHDTVKVSVCGDADCKFHLTGSPKNISVAYTVTPTDRLTVKANVSIGGGITHDSGLFQCSESCEKMIFGVDGEMIRLWPQEQPGFIFTGWSGCDAEAQTSSCTFFFQENSVVEVTANFAPFGPTFELCPGTAGDSFSGNDRVSLAKVNDLIPLCNGYAILAMDDGEIIVRNVTNELEPPLASYDLSSTAYKLALDKENGFLYATHSKNNKKISRINLATSTVSELYYRGTINFEPNQSEPGLAPGITVGGGTLMAPDYELYLEFVSSRAYLYDSATGMFQKTLAVSGGKYQYMDSAGGLFTSISTSQWYFYSFNPSDRSFTLRNRAYASCYDSIMSPDGVHVVWVCRNGQVPESQGDDWDAVNSSASNNIKLGVWNVSVTPLAGVSFSPSSESVVFVGDVYEGGGEFSDGFQLFNVLDHEKIWPGTVIVDRLSGCIPYRAFISTDEKLVYSLSDCNSGSSSALTWVSIAEPE